jgi:hypothetical protein
VAPAKTLLQQFVIGFDLEMIFAQLKPSGQYIFCNNIDR